VSQANVLTVREKEMPLGILTLWNGLYLENGAKSSEETEYCLIRLNKPACKIKNWSCFGNVQFYPKNLLFSLDPSIVLRNFAQNVYCHDGNSIIFITFNTNYC